MSSVSGPRKIYNNMTELIGNTPLVKLNKMTRSLPSNISIYVKCEFMNPTGSVKDRLGKYLVEKAEKRGDLKPGGTIVEATSGNTGLGLALMGVLRGYKTILVMPDKVSKEKSDLLKAFGCEVVLCPTNVEAEDPKSYYSVAKRLAKEHNGFLANQYHNPDNPETHYMSTGPEIWEQTSGAINMFVAGMGTGGTITGVSKYLKEKNPKVKVVGADPPGSVYFDFFHSKKIIEPHQYLVEGIGEDFFPTTMDLTMLDDVIQVEDQECFDFTRRLVLEEGIFTGGSCGAAVVCAFKAAEKYYAKSTKPATIVVLLPDSGNRYLSKVYNDDWLKKNGMKVYGQH